jgi:hypothetical protein
MADEVNTGGAGTGGGEAAVQSPADQEITSLLDGLEKEQASQSADVTPTEAPALPPEVEQWLSKADFSKLPPAVRDQLEKPFKSDYTRKTQALSDERNALATQRADLMTRQEKIMDMLTGRLGERGIQATPDQNELLRQKVAEGDMNAVTQLVENLVQQRVAPVEKNIAQQRGIETAYRTDPNVQKYEGEIAQMIKSDPALQQLVSINNHQYLAQALVGMAAVVHNQKLQAQINEMQAGKAEFAKQVIAEYQKRVQGLPSTSSRAGTAHGEVAPQDLTLDQAMELAAKQSGLGTYFPRR